MKTRKRSHRRRGVAMLEFALVLPILVLIVAGIVEFGRAMTVQTMLTNAAREGARNAILAGATDAGVQTAVNTYLNNSGLASGWNTSITPTSTGAASGTVIHVTVTYPFSSVFTVDLSKFVNNGTAFNGSASGAQFSAAVYMRRE